MIRIRKKLTTYYNKKSQMSQISQDVFHEINKSIDKLVNQFTDSLINLSINQSINQMPIEFIYQSAS